MASNDEKRDALYAQLLEVYTLLTPPIDPLVSFAFNYPICATMAESLRTQCKLHVGEEATKPQGLCYRRLVVFAKTWLFDIAANVSQLRAIEHHELIKALDGVAATLRRVTRDSWSDPSLDIRVHALCPMLRWMGTLKQEESYLTLLATLRVMCRLEPRKEDGTFRSELEPCELRDALKLFKLLVQKYKVEGILTNAIDECLE
jgi:hypothetical protein